MGDGAMQPPAPTGGSTANPLQGNQTGVGTMNPSALAPTMSQPSGPPSPDVFNNSSLGSQPTQSLQASQSGQNGKPGMTQMPGQPFGGFWQ